MAFKRVPGYTLAAIGGACFFCKAHQRNNEIVIDCEKNIAFEGSVFVCEKCAGHMVRIIGGSTKKETEALKEKNAELTEKVSSLQVEVSALDEALRAVRAVDALQAVSS